MGYKSLKKMTSYIRFCLVLMILPATGMAQLKLPRLISDGLVLQRDIEVNVWGWATPGDKVTMSFDSKTFETTTDENGDWNLALPPQKSGGPYDLRFYAGKDITVRNVVFGDVWVCSGQSNMELWMGRVSEKYLDVIADAENPMIRQFLVPDKYDFKKEHNDLDDGEWVMANPESILGFSAVAYFFAKELYDQYEVPIGFINAALGGSPVEAWMSEEALKQFPDSYNELQKFKNDQMIKDIESADRQKNDAWYKEINTKDLGLKSEPAWTEVNVDDSDWKIMEIPGYWTEDAANGVYWFRRKLDIPKKHIGKSAKLWLGRIVDQDYAYINGKMVGSTGYQYPPRRYSVDSLILQQENTISIRVISQSGRGEFVKDKPYYLAVDGDTFDVSGQWKYKLGGAMQPKAGQTFVRWKPGGLYKKMIAPL